MTLRSSWPLAVGLVAVGLLSSQGVLARETPVIATRGGRVAVGAPAPTDVLGGSFGPTFIHLPELAGR